MDQATMTKSILPTLAALIIASSPLLPQENVTKLIVEPSSIRLQGPQATFSLLVDGLSTDDRIADLTRAAKYRSDNPKIASVSISGLVRGLTDGSTTIHVAAGGKAASIKVEVHGSQRQRAYQFERDIMPILSRFGCNSAGCHGNSNGQNGFKLSVFGFDPPADHAALVKEAAWPARRPCGPGVEPAAGQSRRAKCLMAAACASRPIRRNMHCCAAGSRPARRWAIPRRPRSRAFASSRRNASCA